MNRTIPAHPSWCDPRACRHVGGENVDHRSAPLQFKSSTDDYRMTVGLSRFDSVDPTLGFAGSDTVHLELLDLASNNMDGSPRLLGTDLTAADARLLAAALVTVAEQLEAVQAVAR